MRAVDEREPFFRLERDRREPRRLAYGSAFDSLVADERLAFANQAERYVCERREIAGCADGAARGNDRQYVALEQRQQRLDDLGSRAGEASGKGVRFQQEDEPHDTVRQRLADPARMAAHEIELQLAHLVGRDALVRECAEPGRNAVAHSIAAHCVAHGLDAPKHRRTRVRGERDCERLRYERTHIVERERLTVELQGGAHALRPPRLTVDG